MGENCQQIDQAFGPAAKPRAHQSPLNVTPDRVHGSGEAKHGATVDETAAFLLTKTTMRQFDRMRRAHSIFGPRREITEYVDGELVEVVSPREGATAYRVEPGSETPLEARLLS